VWVFIATKKSAQPKEFATIHKFKALALPSVLTLKEAY